MIIQQFLIRTYFVVIPQTRQFVTNDAPAVMDWIETEVVIDSEAEKMNQLPGGQVDDFGLDQPTTR